MEQNHHKEKIIINNFLNGKQFLQNLVIPLSEEQAWALIYQFLTKYQTMISNQSRLVVSDFGLEEIFGNLLLYKTGDVSLLDRNLNEGSGGISVSIKKFMEKIAIFVYKGLDYNLKSYEQRQITKGLEQVLTLMIEDTTTREEDRKYSDVGNRLCEIIEICKKRITLMKPEDHYRTLCASLLSSIVYEMQKEIIQRTKKSKFKANSPFKRNMAAPFNIILEDIRLKRYQLHKVIEKEHLSNEKHNSFLYAIRTAKPLRKASERQLAPPKKSELTLREQLMLEIRNGITLKKVKESKVLTHEFDINKKQSHSLRDSKEKPRFNHQRLIEVDYAIILQNDPCCDENFFCTSFETGSCSCYQYSPDKVTKTESLPSSVSLSSSASLSASSSEHNENITTNYSRLPVANKIITFLRSLS